MLRTLRDGAKSAPMRVFLIVLAVGFALWGIDDVFRAVGSSDKAVEVGPVGVSAVDAAREFEHSRRRYMPASGTSEAVATGLLGNVLSGLLQQSLFLAEAGRLNLTVTREMEKQAIAGEPAFQDELGRFSTIRFHDALARAGFGEGEYIARLRRDLARDQVMDAINGGIRFPQASAETLARWRLERRTVRHATIPVEPGNVPEPGDAEIAAWYAENSSTFDSPDLRFATVALADPDAFLGEVAVDDALLAETYEDRADLYRRSERRALRQMIFDSPGDAAAAVSRLRGGTDFAELARELQGLSADDVDLGVVTRDELTETLAEAAFGLAGPDVAGPAESPLGHHVIEVTEIFPASTVPFDAAKAGLEEELLLELATDLVYERINRLDESLASGSTLEEAARDAGARLLTLDGMDRNGLDRDGNPTGGELEALATDTAFRESVWTAPPGEPGIVEESGNDSFYVVRVDREEAARPRGLEEVRGRVVDAMRLATAIREARETAALVAEAADPAAAALEAGFPFTEAAPIRRDGIGLDDASARLIASRAFGLEPGGTDYVETGSEAIVVTTESVIGAEEATVGDESVLFGERLTGEMLQSAELAVLRGIEELFDVRVNPVIVQQILTGAAN